MVIPYNEPDEIVEKLFPNIGKNYCITSKPAGYNCVAYAADDTSRYWWPTGGHFWPLNVPAKEDVDSFVKCFESLGYCICGLNEVYEEQFEKVAIFVDENEVPQHVAKQFAMDKGPWRSKLSHYKDIMHNLTGISGLFQSTNCANYGNVKIILKKRCSIILQPSVY